jgi:fibronectin type 3 domain-containing protein
VTTQYDDRTAVSGTTYYYKVQACNASTCGELSDDDAGSRAAGPPVKVTGVDASDGTYADKVVITWDALPGAESYRVYRSLTSTGLSYINETSSTSYNDYGGTSGVTYYYRVQAMDAQGYLGDPSDPDTGYRGSGSGVPIPDISSGVSASYDTACDGVHVSWNAVSGATAYEVYRKQVGSGQPYQLLYTTGSASYNDDEAVAGTEYNYKIKACNTSGCSALSDKVTGKRKSPGC